MLFFASIRDNIAYGKDGATNDEIIAAAKVANAANFIDMLPQVTFSLLFLNKSLVFLFAILKAIESKPSCGKWECLQMRSCFCFHNLIACRD